MNVCLRKQRFNLEFDVPNWQMLIRINKHSILLFHITFFLNNIKLPDNDEN